MTAAALSLASAEARELAPGFAALDVVAFTTKRAFGTFGTHGDEPVAEVMGRWAALRDHLRGARLATAKQVHGGTVLRHGTGWTGWLRADDADGHVAPLSGTALAVTVADCVPVFVAHPRGPTALLHSGWRGTAARIVDRAIDLLEADRCPPRELIVHLGPAICGKCYEVSPDVFQRLTGRAASRPTAVDLRAIIASHVRERGVAEVTVSDCCTRCDNDRFFSHRAGDSGRQIAVLLAPHTPRRLP